MKKICSIVILLSICTFCVLSQSLVGSYGEYGPEFHVVCIPDSIEAKIKIDGDILDWNWVPDRYKITSDKLFIYGKNDPVIKDNDLSPMIIIAWSRNMNKLYLVMKVDDDIHVVDRLPFKGGNNADDGFEFAIDPGNRKGSFTWSHNSSHMLMGYMAAPMPGNQDVFGLIAGAQWQIDNDKFIKWGYKISKAANDSKMQTMNYEVELALWDYWNNLGPEYSIRHSLEPFQKIGMVLELNEVDDLKNKNNRKACLTTFHQPDCHWWGNADCFQTFILDPPEHYENNWTDVLDVLK